MTGPLNLDRHIQNAFKRTTDKISNEEEINERGKKE